jgi:hypothetical protein
MRFFFDRNMPPQLARMVDALEREHTARSYYDDDRFTDTTPDVEWIKVLAAVDPPWVIISGDGRILKNKAEFSALKEARLTFFCLSRQWMHMKIYERAWKFITKPGLTSWRTPRGRRRGSTRFRAEPD